MKSPTCVDLMTDCPHLTSLALRGFKLHDYKVRILLKVCLGHFEKEGESKFYFTVMTCLISYQIGFLCFVIRFGQKSLIYYFLIFQFLYCLHSFIPEHYSKGLGDILIPLTMLFLGFLIYCLMYFTFLFL